MAYGQNNEVMTQTARFDKISQSLACLQIIKSNTKQAITILVNDHDK